MSAHVPLRSYDEHGNQHEKQSINKLHTVDSPEGMLLGTDKVTIGCHPGAVFYVVECETSRASSNPEPASANPGVSHVIFRHFLAPFGV